MNETTKMKSTASRFKLSVANASKQEDAEAAAEQAATNKPDDDMDLVKLCGGRKLRIAFVCLLVCTGIALGLLYAYWERSLSQARRTAIFESDSQRMSDSLFRAFGQYVIAAAVGHNYMGVADVPTREDFNSFGDVFINSGLHFQVIGYIPRVLTSQREALEIEAKSYWTKYFEENGIDRNYTGFHGLEPNPDESGGLVDMQRSVQERYYPVHYIHPVEGNLEALDFDLYSSGVRRNTIDNARFSGNPALTARLRLVQEVSASAYSVILFWPGKNDEDHLVSIVVRIPDLMTTGLVQLHSGVEVYLYDNITNAQGGELTYDFLGGHVVNVGNNSLLTEVDLPTILDSATPNVLVNKQTISFADRSWVFVTRSTSEYQRANLTSRVVGGTLLGLLGLLIAGWYIMDVRMHDKVAKHQAVHEIKEANAAASAERRVNAFVAHEVRNPLSVALTANRFTLSKVQDAVTWPDDNAKQCVLHDAGLVQASLTFIHELLDNIVDINQFTQHKLTMNKSSLSMRDHVLLRVQRMLGGESISGGSGQTTQHPQYPTRLVVDTDGDPLWTIADGTRLVQVVLNLVKNAMRLAPEGFITISAHRKTDPNNGVIIKVSDAGLGVPEHMRTGLFDKSTVDLSHQNTGVGLHLCQCIVMSMDGRIYLDESYDSGVANFPGACFVVDLPLPCIPSPDGTFYNQIEDVSPRNLGTREVSTGSNDEMSNVASNNSVRSNTSNNSNSSNNSNGILASLQRRVRRNTNSSSCNTNLINNVQVHMKQASNDEVDLLRRCLVIDDDAVVRAMLRRQLKVCFPNWKIETADSGEAALALVKPKTAGGLGLQFDVCLVDQYMPGPNNPMTGDQVIGVMRNINMAGYRIGCSANQVEALHVSAGADGFIRKPADNAALREVMKNVFSCPPLRSCLLIGQSKTARAELRNRLQGAVASNCVFVEVESVNAAIEFAQTARSRDAIAGGIELIVIDEVSCVSEKVLASEVAKRLRLQVSSAAKVVIVSSSGGAGDDSDGNTSAESGGSRKMNMPVGISLTWARPLPLAGDMRADLMRVLLPSGGCATALLEIEAKNEAVLETETKTEALLQTAKKTQALSDIDTDDQGVVEVVID